MLLDERQKGINFNSEIWDEVRNKLGITASRCLWGPFGSKLFGPLATELPRAFFEKASSFLNSISYLANSSRIYISSKSGSVPPGIGEGKQNDKDGDISQIDPNESGNRMSHPTEKPELLSFSQIRQFHFQYFRN